VSSSAPDELVAALSKAKVAPDSEETWDELDELARSTNQPDDVSKLYRDVLATDLPKDVISRLGERAVAFHEEWFEDTTFVIEILRRVLAVDRGADWAFERLSLLLTMAERWDDLLDEYDRALDAAEDPEKRKALLDEAARIAKDFAGQTNRAIGYLKALVPLRPEDAQLAQSLERRLTVAKRFPDLVEVWTARLAVLEPAEALATRVRIAETWLDRLEDAATALETVQQLIDAGGSATEICRLLEKIGTAESADQAVRRAALSRLKEQLAESGPPEAVIDAVQLQLSVAETSVERVALHREARDRLAEVGRHGEAVRHGANLLALEPTLDERDRLKALVETADAHEAYLGALVEAAGATSEGTDRVAFLIEAGHEAQDRLNDAERAVALFTSVLADEAADAEQLLDVARRLTDLLTGDARAVERLRVLERRAELEPKKKDKRRVLGEAAQLADAMGDTDHALELWAKRLEADAKDMEALDASVAILEGAGRWERLIAVLRQRAAAHASGSPERRENLVHIASVYQRKLEDIEQAIAVWREVQEEFGSNAETVDALANLSAAARRWTDVVGLLRAAAAEEEDAERRANQLARMGDVYREQRNSAMKAVESYREAVQVDPRHSEARAGLLALLDHADAGRAAVETLTSAYTAADEWQGILELVERRVALAPDDAFRKHVLVDAAWLEENRAANSAAGLGYLRRAFALVPEPELERELRRLAEATGDFATLAAGYAEAIERTEDEARRRQLLMDHGAVLEQSLADHAGALASYERVVASDPGHVEAARAVARVGASTGAWKSVAAAFVEAARARNSVDRTLSETIEAHVNAWDAFTDALDAAVMASASLDDLVAHDLLDQLGRWHRDRRGDLGAAENAFERAVARTPNASTLNMLAEIQREAPGESLVRTLLRLADVTGDDLDALHEAGNVALFGVQDRTLGRPILERVLAVASIRWREHAADPEISTSAERYALWATDHLVHVSADEGDAAGAVNLLIQSAALPCAPEISRQLRFRAASMAAESLNDTARAVALCGSILDEAPDDTSALGLLASLYAKEGRTEDLLDLRRRELSLKPSVDRRLEIRLDIVRVLGELGAAVEERVAALLDNLADHPGHEASIETLSALLEEQGRHAELLGIVTKQAERVQELGDARRGAALWARAGQLAEDPVSDVDRALEAYRRSVDLEPSLPVLDALARIHTARGQHAVAVKWLEQRLSRTGRSPDDVGAHRDTVLRLAQAQHAAGQEERARDSLVQALREDPAAGKLRELLASLYRESEDWQLLAPLLAEGVEYAPDAEAKVDLLRQAAQVHRRRLGDVESAIPLLEGAVQLAPQDRAVRLALADALRVGKRYEEARGLLNALLEEFGRRRTPERAAVHFHLARIARAMGELDEALSQLESASSIERSDARILQLLGTVAREKGDLDRAERAYRALLLIVRRQQASEDEEDLVAASEIMYDLYRIAVDQGQSDRANDLLDSAFETAAENNFEALRLERALRVAGQTDHVLRVLETRLGRIDDPAAATEILCARADLFAQTGRLDEALDSLLEALERTPASPKLSASAYELAAQAGAVDRYVKKLSDAAERAEEPRTASTLWLKLGQTAETDLGDREAAAGFYERALATGVRVHRAYSALLAVLPEEATERRAAAMKQFADAPEDPEGSRELRTEVLYAVAADELASAETCSEGAAHLEEALGREMRTELALQLLRAAATLVPRNERVVRLFERVAREAGEPVALLEALQLSADLEATPVAVVEDAIDLARRLGSEAAIGRLLERLVSLARASGTLASYAWALHELARRRQAEGEARGALELLREAADLSEGAEAYELKLQVAGLAAGPLNEQELASALYEDLLRAQPTDARVWKPLLEVYRALGDRDRLEACISATIEAVYDPAERNTLRMERGRILLEDAERVAEAEAVLREVLEDEPAHVQASLVLAELFERQGRTEELNDLLGRQLDAARARGDAGAVVSLSLRIGQSLEAERPGEATRLYRSSLEVAPQHRALLEALLRVVGAEAAPGERADIMEQLLVQEEGDRAADLALELAGVRRALDDASAAERALAAGFRACPGRSDIRDQLEQLYEESENHAGLAELITLDAGARPDDETAVARFRKAAALYASELGDPGQAADVLGRARGRRPDDMSLAEAQLGHLISAGRVEDAFVLINDLVANETLNGSERGGFLARRAQLRLDLGVVDLTVLTAAIDDADRAAALGGGGHDKFLLDLLERQRSLAADVGDEAAEREATMRLAHLSPKAGDHRRGLELLVGWVKRFPMDAGAVRELGHFAAGSEKWTAAAKAYQRLVEITEGEDQIDAVVRLAEACERADTPMEAKGALEAVYARAPDNETIRAWLRRMYEAAHEYEALANIILAEADQAADEDTRFTRLVEAGDLSLRVEGAQRTAVSAFERALEIRPDSHETVIRLADTLGALGEIEQAAKLLDAAINAHGKKRSPELSQLQHCMARIGKIAEDYEAVFAWLDAAVASDRQNGAAAAELAVIAMERGELDTAIKALQAVSLLKDAGPMSRAEAYLRQGMIAEQRGDRKKAVFLAKRALTTEPEYEEAKMFLEQLESG
jgi:tetratricopeptide (TPR) repeat protein